MILTVEEQQKQQANDLNIKQYYRLQARIYDFTRWTFLFGRDKLLRLLSLQPKGTLLEIGCGTGYNLKQISKKYPDSFLIGMDISEEMLSEARQKLLWAANVLFLHCPYQQGDISFNNRVDIALFSYSLTMINPNWENLIQQTKIDLTQDGYIAVVDFHRTQFKWYHQFMQKNHVRLDGHLLPVLQKEFITEYLHIGKGYLGIWEYFVFIGKNTASCQNTSENASPQ